MTTGKMPLKEIIAQQKGTTGQSPTRCNAWAFKAAALLEVMAEHIAALDAYAQDLLPSDEQTNAVQATQDKLDHVLAQQGVTLDE